MVAQIQQHNCAEIHRRDDFSFILHQHGGIALAMAAAYGVFPPFPLRVCPKRPLRDGDFESASWLLFLGTQRSWYGFGRLPGRVRFFLKFSYWLFVNYGKAPGSHRGTEGMAMAAPPCCAQVLLLALRELRKGPWLPSRNRGDGDGSASLLCTSPRAGPRGQSGRMSHSRRCFCVSCAVMYSRRSSRPQPMGSGGDATPCKVTREDRRLYF